MIYLDFFGGAGGVGRVSRELIPALAHVSGDPVTVAGPSYAVDSLRAILTGCPEVVRFIGLTPPKFSLRRVVSEFALRTDPIRGHAFAFFLAELRRQGEDAATLPFVNFPQVLHPPRDGERFAIFIHDLNWRSFPENFTDPERLDRWCRGWIEQSTITFTNSEFTRQEIINSYRVAPEKVVAAPLAPFPLRECISNAESVRVELEKLGLEAGRYYLYPGVHGAHKGHDTLASALNAGTQSFPVVVTCGWPSPEQGRNSAARRDQLRSLANEFSTLQQSRRLIVLSNLTDSQMDMLRKNCRAFILPSRYEGFGFPLVEAMQTEKPVICTSIPAFSEILARYPGRIESHRFQAGDAQELAGLLEADFSGSCSFEARRMEHTDAAAWNWEDTAKTILEAMAALPSNLASR